LSFHEKQKIIVRDPGVLAFDSLDAITPHSPHIFFALQGIASHEIHNIIKNDVLQAKEVG
jgi:hypothetical protein